jgi:DNA-binding PadR family transcriptional regulator
MHARTLLLAILGFGETTGYDIKKMSEEGPFSYFIDISYGAIYPTLAKLEEEGCVASRIESQQGKPDRKVYSITDKGRLEFAESLAIPPGPDKFKSDFLLVAAHAAHGTPETLKKAIDSRIEYIEKEIAMIAEHCAECDHPATKWVGDYGVHIMQADVDYLKRNRDGLIELAGADLLTSEAAQ